MLQTAESPPQQREPITMKALLEAGVHFGHQTRRWNPRMKRYIFTQRNGIHIIDLQQTLVLLNEACKAVTQLVADGGDIIFVGTKRQAQDAMQQEASRCGMPYVNQRWLGGSLTNFGVIHSRVMYLRDLEEKKEKGYFRRLPRKEALKLEETLNKLHRYYDGLKAMDRVPQAMFVVDLGMEKNCVAEARRTGVSIVGLVDTDCDPLLVDHAIPGNDDAIRSIRLMAGRVADAVNEGKRQREAMLAEEGEGEEPEDIEEEFEPRATYDAEAVALAELAELTPEEGDDAPAEDTEPN
jgi:small subunit ribosomal protein S2